MRTIISKMMMFMAAFIMLLMSAIPHHHHCTEAETIRHIDYICFAADETCEDGDDDHDMEDHQHHEICLHSIVTLLERVMRLPFIQSVCAAIIPCVLMSEAQATNCKIYSEIPVREKLPAAWFGLSTGFRAPPVSA